jgi:hypothetical protein
METKVEKRPYRKTDAKKRAEHTVSQRPPFVCKCGQEFHTYRQWREHMVTASLREG